MPTDGAFGMAFVKIVSPEFVIRATIAHDVVRDGQDAVPHCDHRFLVATMSLEPMISGLKCGAVAAARSQAGLDQRATQIAIALTRLPAVPLPGTLILAWTDRGPTTDGNRLISPARTLYVLRRLRLRAFSDSR